MMKKINKKLLDELIRIERKYWKTGDTDLLDKQTLLAHDLSKFTFGNDGSWLKFSDFVGSIVASNGLKKSATNQDIYNAFAVLGYEVAGEG